jgi:hypothetical protein
VTSQHQRASRATEIGVEPARYEADRAERAFTQVEPQHRLAARTPQARWEKLAAPADAEHALQAAQAALPPLPGRASLATLAADLPALWHAPTTTARDRKRLLRTLIADIRLRHGFGGRRGITSWLARRPVPSVIPRVITSPEAGIWVPMPAGQAGQGGLASPQKPRNSATRQPVPTGTPQTKRHTRYTCDAR